MGGTGEAGGRGGCIHAAMIADGGGTGEDAGYTLSATDDMVGK